MFGAHRSWLCRLLWLSGGGGGRLLGCRLLGLHLENHLLQSLILHHSILQLLLELCRLLTPQTHIKYQHKRDQHRVQWSIHTTRCHGNYSSKIVHNNLVLARKIHKIHTYIGCLSHPHTCLCTICSTYIFDECLSTRQLILRRISEIVCMYVYVYPSRLGIQLFRTLPHKRSITCAIVMLRNVTAVPATEVRGEKSSVYNYSVGRRRTQRSGSQPKYEPIRAACNRLAQLSTYTYLLQRRCDSGERRVRST